MQSPTQNSGAPDTIGSEVRADAERLTSTASDRLHSELDARKGAAATQAKSLSSAISQAADGLDDGAPQWLRSAFQQGAHQAQRFADTLEQKDSRAILRDVQDMARNNPGTFLAACAALGFAAARVFKAGAPDSSSSQSRPAQLPPIQGQEPMFRPSGAQTTSSPAPAGELV